MATSFDLSRYEALDVYHASDAHNEHVLWQKKQIAGLTYEPKPVSRSPNVGNILLLSGDMLRFRKYYQNVKWLERASFEFDLVVYVLGNHEFYTTSLDKVHRKLKLATKHIKNLVVLENEDVIVKSKESEIAIIGATFWVDFDPTKDGVQIKSTMDRVGYFKDKYNYEFTDFYQIRNRNDNGDYPRIRPSALRCKHLESKDFIFDKAKEHKANGRKVVVLTHHSPSYFSATHFNESCWLSELFLEQGENTRLPVFNSKDILKLNDTPFEWGTAMYCSRLESEILESSIDYWGHGHLHNSRNYLIGQTEVDDNPIGYYTSRNKRFRDKPWFRWEG